MGVIASTVAILIYLYYKVENLIMNIELTAKEVFTDKRDNNVYDIY